MGAASENHAETVQVLIDAGADVDAKDNDGWTTLIWASKEGQSEIVQIMIDAGANVNAKGDEYKVTALIGGAREGHTDIVQVLLRWHCAGQSAGSGGVPNVQSVSFIIPDLSHMNSRGQLDPDVRCYFIGGIPKSLHIFLAS